jgi:hypothetical protein
MKQLFIFTFILVVSAASSQPLVNLTWAHSSDTPNTVIPYQASVFDNSGNLLTAGNTYTVGQMENYVLIKYDINGNRLWKQEYNGSSNATDFATDLTVSQDGYIYVTGVESNSGGGTSMTTLKYDSTGTLIWT